MSNNLTSENLDSSFWVLDALRRDAATVISPAERAAVEITMQLLSKEQARRTLEFADRVEPLIGAKATRSAAPAADAPAPVRGRGPSMPEGTSMREIFGGGPFRVRGTDLG